MKNRKCIIDKKESKGVYYEKPWICTCVCIHAERHINQAKCTLALQILFDRQERSRL